ncbi:dihydrofolate synthase / folylpolyglutamate synthase [Actinobaculum suis]|nr:dihydrofolate synthase / folylpolyglutamate synthase [Actinobaculum suis]
MKKNDGSSFGVSGANPGSAANPVNSANPGSGVNPGNSVNSGNSVNPGSSVNRESSANPEKAAIENAEIRKIIEFNALDDAEQERAAAGEAENAEEAELSEALQILLGSELIAGPDPSVVEDVKAQPEPETGPLADLAATAALDAEVDAIYQQILTRAPEHKVQPSLQRVRDCLDMMGNPQNSYRSVHVTGTNGKTSTARMIEALLREMGLHTGRFTSPHLENVRERISINGAAISREDFIQAWEDVAPFVELVDKQSVEAGGPRMSFFEVFVVMAYQAFAYAPVDVAVVEVGMGGEWDATNVIDSSVAVLTPIALDHQRWLGASVEEIAHEKVGIIKPGAAVISATQTPSVLDIIADKTRAQHGRLEVYGRDLEVLNRETAVGGQLISIRTPAATYEDIPLALRGDFQAENAALALGAVEAFRDGGALSGDVVEHAFMAVSSPGRLEVVRSSPTVVVDAAHNPAGAEATARALAEYYPGRRVGVIAMMADKDVEGTLGFFEPIFESVVVTDMPTTRAMDADDLAEIARDVFGEDRVSVERNLMNAIDTAAGLAEEDNPEPMITPVVVVTGSIELVGEARRLMGKKAPDGAE